MSHTAYVAAAYGASALALIGLAIWVVLGSHARKRELAELEAFGLRRRSDRAEDA
jgi:heme exporter protein D